MKRNNWKQTLLWVAAVETVGILSGLLSGSARGRFDAVAIQPELTPPGWVFPVVWSVLYALMGISAARIWRSPESSDRNRGLNLFVAQLIFNFFWSLIFFNAGAYGFAAIWLGILWLLTAAMILAFYRVDPPAAYLQIPYLLWLSFALYLNIAVWQLNR